LLDLRVVAGRGEALQSSRIERAFRLKYAQLLAHWPAVPSELEVGTQLAAVRAAATAGALARELDVAFRRVLTLTDRHPTAAASRRAWIQGMRAAGVRFECDASLGGLARWLRAYGYEAHRTTVANVDGLRHAALRAIVLTSSGELYEQARRTSPPLPVLWQASQVRPPDQLHSVVVELRIERRDPLCMTCGGALRIVKKNEVGERIPARTARWLDLYFVCGGCDGLFWRGTHWQRIERHLSKVAAGLSCD
jgi:uncharacterized protein